MAEEDGGLTPEHRRFMIEAVGKSSTITATTLLALAGVVIAGVVSLKNDGAWDNAAAWVWWLARFTVGVALTSVLVGALALVRFRDNLVFQRDRAFDGTWKESTVQRQVQRGIKQARFLFRAQILLWVASAVAYAPLVMVSLSGP